MGWLAICFLAWLWWRWPVSGALLHGAGWLAIGLVVLVVLSTALVLYYLFDRLLEFVGDHVEALE